MPGHLTLTAPSVQALAVYLEGRCTALGYNLGCLRRGEVAQLLKISERTVARALSLLRSAGAVDVDKQGCITVQDYERLSAVGTSAPLASRHHPTASPSMSATVTFGCITGLRDEVRQHRDEVKHLRDQVALQREDIFALHDLITQLTELIPPK